MAPSNTVVTVDNRTLTVSNLDKVMYPSTGTTKAEVIEYYRAIAPVMLPHVRDRPVTRKRWVHGVGTEDQPGQVFFHKNLEDSAPEWVERRSLQHSDHTTVYPLANDRATLCWFAQIAALELHVPQWRFDAAGTASAPDRLVLDLDPGEGVGITECAEVARWVRDILRGMGWDPQPVTSGSKGIHLYAAVDGSHSSEQLSSLAHELARSIEADHPGEVVSDMKRSLRTGKVLIDWSQNSPAKTTVAPYSLRGRLRPTVAAPRTWRELSSAKLAQLEFPEVLRRVQRRGDLLGGLLGHSRPPANPAEDARLERYRSMRDETRTAEPMGSSQSTPAGDRPTFVIQEHHARRLHWDFRLEHEGVLVSWALPKGVPTDPAHNHLAVQTEDHPLDYGTFSGTIPKGEYGAGTVTIWDSGTYELVKWKDDKEIIVVLDGTRLGRQKFALIRTGGSAKKQNWLIHLMVEPLPDAATRPMLAALGSPTDVGEEWSCEMKWDGIRALAHVTSDGYRLISRNGIDMTDRYPELAELRDAVTAPCILDGEIVALTNGRPDFGRLATRMQLTKARDVAAAVTRTPVHFMVFDILASGSESLLRDTYVARRARLLAEVTATTHIAVPAAYDGNVEAAMATSAELGLEGVVAKRDGSTYQPGVRSRDWIKIKHSASQEVVVIGWRTGQGSRSDTFASLLLAVPDGDTLRYVGRVGTGFSDAALADAAARLARLSRSTPPAHVPAGDAKDAHWVTPNLVGEVTYAEVTSEGRLRHPVWKGWRIDKTASEVTEED